MTTGTATMPPVTARRWPDVARVPTGPRAVIGERVASGIFRHAVASLPLRVVLPSGERLGAAGRRDAPVMRVHDQASMMRRIGTNGLIGFGESYLAGEWDADDLAAVIAVFASSVGDLVPGPLRAMRRMYLAAQPGSDRATAAHARDNARRHYDLSNELFAAFLDETMTYSAALFDDPSSAGWDDLAAAQRAKSDRLLDRAGVRPGTRLLEVGTGWGDLAVRAARRGAMVDSVTLSDQQLRYTQDRVTAEGLNDQVHLALQDYRQLSGSYDAIVSVEMVEAVGLEFLPIYFATLGRCLAPGGRVALQAITMPHQRAITTQDTYTWIHKYIFPGGAIPSTRMLTEQAAPAGLQVIDDLAMGASYAATLRLWATRFTEHADQVTALGFDDIFQRMWNFYLRYCQGGFDAGYLNVHQLTYQNTGHRSGRDR